MKRLSKNHCSSASSCVMPRLRTMLGYFTRVGSLCTKSLEPPSMYSFVSTSTAMPVHSEKRPMGRSGWSLTLKRSSATGSGRV